MAILTGDHPERER